MSKWQPKLGRLETPVEAPEPRVNNEAILNPIPEGTRVRVTQGENVLTGKVKHTAKEWGSCFWLEVPLARSWAPDSIAIDVRDWESIEILEDVV